MKLGYRITAKHRETGEIITKHAKNLKEAKEVFAAIDGGVYLKNLFSRQSGFYRVKEFDEIL